MVLVLRFSSNTSKLELKGIVMKSGWALDVVDLKKSMMKVHKLESSVAKTFFVPSLIEAKLHLTTLVATCKDCTWVIDVETGLRRRVSEKTMVGASEMPNVINRELPEFLKKTD